MQKQQTAFMHTRGVVPWPTLWHVQVVRELQRRAAPARATSRATSRQAADGVCRATTSGRGSVAAGDAVPRQQRGIKCRPDALWCRRRPPP